MQLSFSILYIYTAYIYHNCIYPIYIFPKLFRTNRDLSADEHFLIILLQDALPVQPPLLRSFFVASQRRGRTKSRIARVGKLDFPGKKKERRNRHCTLHCTGTVHVQIHDTIFTWPPTRAPPGANTPTFIINNSLEYFTCTSIQPSTVLRPLRLFLAHFGMHTVSFQVHAVQQLTGQTNAGLNVIRRQWKHRLG